MVEKAKKDRKRRTISSFTILLIMLIALAIITVIMSWAGTQGVTGATVADVATAPVKGFTDALPVCLFVLILGGFLGIVTETGALDAGIAALVKKLKGDEATCRSHPHVHLLHRRHDVRHVRGNGAVLPAACGHDGGGGLRQHRRRRRGALGRRLRRAGLHGEPVRRRCCHRLAFQYRPRHQPRRHHRFGRGVVAGHACYLHSVRRCATPRRSKRTRARTILSLQEQEVMRAEYGEGRSRRPSKRKSIRTEKLMTARQKWSLVAFGLTFVVMIIGFIPWAKASASTSSTLARRPKRSRRPSAATTSLPRGQTTKWAAKTRSTAT